MGLRKSPKYVSYNLPPPPPLSDRRVSLHYLYTCATSWRSWRKGVFSAALTLTLAASKALFKEVGGFSSSGSLFFIIISKEFICNILETKKNKFLSFVDVRSVARP